MSRIIGIDLGTTNTCAAFVSNKIPRVVPIEGGFNTMPSVVCYHPSGAVYVGETAKEYLVTQPEHTIHEIKRLLGRSYASRTVQEIKRRMRYEIVPTETGEAGVKVGGRVYTTVEVQARVLEQIKRYAEIHLGEDIPEAVIAVPAYFSDHQRQLVKKAGELAGWNVRRVVNEPTAAALAYGFNRGFNQKILIYDFGGGTFDVSILALDGNVFEVIATGGDIFLGGADFDDRVLVWILEEFKKKTKLDLSDDTAAMQRLRAAAERAKIELSLLANTQIRLSEIVERKGKSIDLDLVLSRETLNDLTRDLVQRSLAVVDKLLAERGIERREIEEIIPVGGQTRMPLVVDSITAHMGKPPRKGVSPDECVALGAALLGDSLAKSDAVTLLDALSVPIGVAAPDGSLRVLLDKHARLPQKATLELETSADGQDSIEVDVFQGERGPVNRAEYLGTIRYDGLPKEPKGAAKVTLELALDHEGLLAVTASSNRTSERRRVKLATVGRAAVPEELVVAGHAQEPSAEESGGRSSIKDLMRSLWGGKR